MNKKSFILYHDQEELVDQLSDAQAGKLLKAFYDFNAGREVSLDKTLTLLFTPFKQQFKRDTAKWEKIVERNKENIAKRWNKKEILKDTKNTSGKSGIPKYLDNDNDNDNDNDKASLPEEVAKLAAFLGKDFRYENGKAYRSTANGWIQIHNTSAYWKKLESHASPTSDEIKPKEMTDEQIISYLSGKRLGRDEGINQDIVYEALNRGIYHG